MDREFVREEVSAVLKPVVQAAIKRALGIKYLVTRDGAHSGPRTLPFPSNGDFPFVFPPIWR